MRLTKFLRGCVVALTCLSMMSSQFIQAAGIQPSVRSASTAPTQVRVQDVSLQEGGVFTGNLVNDRGVGQPAVPVIVSRLGKIVAKTETDANGQFAVQGLSGGAYEVQTPIGQGTYRLWAPRTAPPSAQSVATIVAGVPDQPVVLGQGVAGSAFGWLANPWVLAGIVAAAIAIPLALDNNDAS